MAAPAAARPEAAPRNMEDLMAAASYDSQEEAQLARELVRGAGIPAYLSNEHSVAMIRARFAGFNGLELLVPASALDSAREVLAARVSDEELAGEALADTSYIRHGVGAVRPYLYGRLDLPDFVQQVFGAVELERHDFRPTAAHVEVAIGDSVVVMEASDPPVAAATPASIYVYVADVDAAYARALEAGGVVWRLPPTSPTRSEARG
jgi:PhnB protein